MASAPHATLYAAVDGQVARVSPSECVFRDRATRTPHGLPIAALEALDACRAFATLDEHAAQLATHHTGIDATAARSGLEALAARGLFVTAEAFLAEGSGMARPAPALRAVFIRACDRPALLARLLDSLAENERSHRAGHRYVVLDDSRDASCAREHATLVASFGARAGVRAAHVDAARWARLAVRLGEPAPAAAARALARDGVDGARFGGGKGYNLAALLGAGAAYALLDDDFVLPLARSADALPGLQLGGSPDSPARFHADAEAAFASGTPLEGDPFAAALLDCGQPLGTLWSREPYRVPPHALRGFAPSLAPQLHGRARVASIVHGHRGDTGALSNDWIHVLDEASRLALTATPVTYANALARGAVWYGPARARIDEQSAFTPFLVDAREFVPPTRAEGRSEDLLFGALIAACAPDTVSLHTNATIGHLQEAGRPRPAAQDAPAPATNRWIAELARAAGAELRADAPGARARGLAGVLRDIAEASPARRLELVDDYVRFAHADVALRLADARAAASDAPDPWRRDLDRRLDARRRALLDPTPQRLSDAPPGADPAEMIRATLAAFADVLDAWPRLHAHAAQCAESLLEE